MQGIALQRPRIGIGILLEFFKKQELVLVFYWQNKNSQNWYWYFIGAQKTAMPNPAAQNMFSGKSLEELDLAYCIVDDVTVIQWYGESRERFTNPVPSDRVPRDPVPRAPK